MIFIYPYKRKENDFCIKQSVRLVMKHYPDARCITIGDKVEGIENIPFIDSHKLRGSNVTAKCLHASKLFKEFIYMNDDFFINERFDFNKTYAGMELLERKEGKASIAWNQAVDNTKHYLEHYKYPTITFECHQPVKFESKKLQETFKGLDWKENDHFLKSLYFNINQPKKLKLIENTKLIEPNTVRAQKLLDMYGVFSVGLGFLTEKGCQFIKNM